MAESDLAVYTIIGLNDSGDTCRLIPFSQDKLDIIEDNNNKEDTDKMHTSSNTNKDNQVSDAASDEQIVDDTTMSDGNTNNTSSGAQQTNYEASATAEKDINSMHDASASNAMSNDVNVNNYNIADESPNDTTQTIPANTHLMRIKFKKLYKLYDHLPKQIIDKFKKFCKRIRRLPRAVRKLLRVKIDGKSETQACINDNYFDFELFLKILFSNHIYKLLLFYNKEAYMLSNIFKNKINYKRITDLFGKGEY